MILQKDLQVIRCDAGLWFIPSLQKYTLHFQGHTVDSLCILKPKVGYHYAIIEADSMQQPDKLSLVTLSEQAQDIPDYMLDNPNVFILRLS